jgi:hypothetical protein
VAVDAEGRIIVVDMIRQVVSVFTPDGVFLGRHGGMGFAPGAMAFPSDVASDGERRLYVVEKTGNRLQIFDEEAGVIGARPPRGSRQVPAAVREELRRSFRDAAGGQR